MNKVDGDYFVWLVSQIATPPNKTYNELFSRMFDLEFVWTVASDHNRIQDGLDLRDEFLNGTRKQLTLQGVSILEVLVALSRRVAFTAGGDEANWAWRLVKNLGLSKASDPLTNGKMAKVEQVLEALVWRTYQPDGRGGFFPLKRATEDQRNVEIWYQMNAYVIEMDNDHR